MKYCISFLKFARCRFQNTHFSSMQPDAIFNRKDAKVFRKGRKGISTQMTQIERISAD